MDGHASSPARWIVALLAAWIALCCCEKRMFAAMLGVELPRCADAATSCCVPAPAPAAAPCCGGCCDDREAPAPEHNDGDEDDRAPGSCCSDGCCAKTAQAPTTDALAFDSCGTPLPATLIPQDRGEMRACCSRLRMAWIDPDPPPRLALVVSARLRI